jgi:hypothetical protein
LPAEESLGTDRLVVAQQYARGEVMLELDMVGPASRVNMTQPHDGVPEVANLALFQARHLPDLPDLSERLANVFFPR